MQIPYQPIFNSSIRSTFHDYISSLKVPFIDYFAIGIQDPINARSTSLMSRIEWQRTFTTMGFAKDDPIRIATLHSNRNVFSFDSIDCLNSLGNEIMLERKRHSISNGIVIMDRRKSHNYMLTLATDYSNFDGNEFFLKHHTDIYRIFKDFIAIINPVSPSYILE